MEKDSPSTGVMAAMQLCTPARRAQMLVRDMLPTRIRPTRRVDSRADRIVAAVRKRGSMCHRDLQKQRCYRTLDAGERERIMASLLKSGRLVLRDTRTCESQPASHGIRYFAGAQD